MQNHDHVGNRALGERLGTLVSFEALKCAVGLLLAAPALPLLFMGEEYGESAPFHFFVSFLDPALAEAVRRGRREEFQRFGWAEAIPDPSDLTTFTGARLNHALAGAPRHRELGRYYARWLALRREHPALGARHKARCRAHVEGPGDRLVLDRSAPSGEAVRLIANLTGEPRPVGEVPPGSATLIDSADAAFAGPGSATPLGPWQLLLFASRG